MIYLGAVSQNPSLVGEGPLDSLRDLGGDGQMGTDGLEAVLVGNIVHTVLLTIITNVLVESVGAEGGRVGSDVVHLAGLLSQDPVLSLVQVMVSIDLVLVHITENSIATLALAVAGLGLVVHGLDNLHHLHGSDLNGLDMTVGLSLVHVTSIVSTLVLVGVGIVIVRSRVIVNVSAGSCVVRARVVVDVTAIGSALVLDHTELGGSDSKEGTGQLNGEE